MAEERTCEAGATLPSLLVPKWRKQNCKKGETRGGGALAPDALGLNLEAQKIELRYIN
jgi:hypothetical protein